MSKFGFTYGLAANLLSLTIRVCIWSRSDRAVKCALQMHRASSQSMVWPNVLQMALGCCITAMLAYAQDLVPRAYLIAPVGANAITLSTSFFDGPVATDPTIPVTDFNARYAVSSLSYSRALAFFGRSANIVGTIPYVTGNFHGTVIGVPKEAYRSGLVDSRFRFSVNLRGGRAMRAKDFVEWREKFVVGTSFTVIAPTGQYDPARLINLGFNRWGFKSEVGLSRRWGPWALDVYGGVWFYTANHSFYPGSNTRTQEPVGATEMHLSYTVKPRFWASLDGNFWTGGQTKINGIANHDFTRDSRVGATVSLPVSRHQALKFSFSDGAYISIGGNYKNISAAWQYSWLSSDR